jgi:hypothetical protein
VEAPLPVAPTSWQHGGLRWDSESGEIGILLDGVEAATATTASFKMPDLPADFELGASGFFIDDFRLYNHRLDLPAVQSLARPRD